MAEVLTSEEMKCPYDGEWLLVDCQAMDDEMNVIQGQVILHFPDRHPVYDAIAHYRRTHRRTLAIESVGDEPEWMLML
ncbi:MAG: hypothetical protein MUF49_17250 [Oculatellaceae cyanobacterium Prado106]|jgi:hypothetical protein|nr:hypothetical protein [Oculatellaceae cyanobacterium Prado106]